MSGWRIGFAVSQPGHRRRDRQADQHVRSRACPRSCSWPAWPPCATTGDATSTMAAFRSKVELLVEGLQRHRRRLVRRCRVARSTSSPTSPPICNRLGITSHGLAMYLLEGRRRRVRRGLPRRRVLRRGRQRLSAVQLRRARRAHCRGLFVHGDGIQTCRPRRGVPPDPSRVPARRSLRAARARVDSLPGSASDFVWLAPCTSHG